MQQYRGNHLLCEEEFKCECGKEHYIEVWAMNEDPDCRFILVDKTIEEEMEEVENE